jgi:hypothetical protein
MRRWLLFAAEDEVIALKQVPRGNRNRELKAWRLRMDLQGLV